MKIGKIKIKIIFLCLSLILIFSFKRVVKGEYVIDSKKDTSEAFIQKKLSLFPPDIIRPIGKKQFFIKYKKDPGLIQLQKSVDRSITIQPNYIYKSN